MDRRRLVLGFWLTVVGLALAILVAGPLTPSPPPCSTNLCNGAYVSDLLGLGLVIVGMSFLASGLWRGETVEGPATMAPGNPLYTFAPPGPAEPAPLPAASPPPGAASTRTCPGCGASVTAEYGFCPRCGRTLAR